MTQKEQILSLLEEMYRTIDDDAIAMAIYHAITRIDEEIPDDTWISVEERMPEKQVRVLTYGRDHKQQTLNWD